MLLFLNRSIVLMATKGKPEGVVGVAPHLVTLGMAKTADLSNVGESYASQQLSVFFM